MKGTWRWSAREGYTFIELIIVTTIVLILASAILPLARVTAQRTREAELRRALREMRTAIDKYKDAADTGQIGSLEVKVGSEGYPPDLQTLVDGVAAANDVTGRKLKYLRRIPHRSDDARARNGANGPIRTSPTRRAGEARTSSTSTRRSTARGWTARSIGTGDMELGFGNWDSGFGK